MLKIESENFQPTKDYFFVAADSEKAAKRTLAPGVEIIIDQRFNPHNRGIVTQDGVVRYVPMRITGGKSIDIKKGDKIYFHHSVCDEGNKVDVNGEVLYHALYEHSAYCKIENGDVIMLNDFNLIEAVAEADKSSIIITPDSAKKKSGDRGIARHITKQLFEEGVRKGDTIIFTKNSDYDIDVEGKMYYCMRNRDIVAIIGK